MSETAQVPGWIIADDGPLLALNKPAGLMTQGAPAPVPSLEYLVKTYLKERFTKPGNVYLGVPHRLDRPVSGIVVLARNSKAAARLAEQFRDRTVRKTYLALTEQTPPSPTGELVDWLVKDEGVARMQVSAEQVAGAQQAVLRYRTVHTFGPRALLEIELETGRMHQIRVQLAARGWPVCGDTWYGAQLPWPAPAVTTSSQVADIPLPSTSEIEQVVHEPDSTPPEQDPALVDQALLEAAVEATASRGLALHALQLELHHPVRYDRLTLRAPIPASWQEAGVAGLAAVIDAINHFAPAVVSRPREAPPQPAVPDFVGSTASQSATIEDLAVSTPSESV